MFQVVGIVALVILIGWIIHRAVNAQRANRPVKDVLNPHVVMYGLACVAGVCSLAYFLEMDDVPKFIKVIACVTLGIALIVVASLAQRKARTGG